jgi:hypothetical protein
MEINETKIKQAQEEALDILQKSEDKSQAIIQAIEKINEAEHANLIAEITMQAAMAKSDEDYAKKLGLRVLNKEEKVFCYIYWICTIIVNSSTISICFGNN